jgi:hypothetical protein
MKYKTTIKECRNLYEVVDKYKNYLYSVWFHDTQGYRCGYVQIPENHRVIEELIRIGERKDENMDKEN